MTKQAHSKFGASSASRWLNCPGSVKLSATVPPQKSSGYALEGTAAHRLAEICLVQDYEPTEGTFLTKGEKKQHKDYLLSVNRVTEDDIEVTQDMADAVKVYVDYVRSLRGEMNIETKFDLSFIEPEMFGTNDCCVYDRLLGVLEVIDYKHGSGVAVSPEENSQLAYYGLGAAKIYELHPNSTIKLTIVQPRAAGAPIKSWTTTVGYLDKFAKTLKKGVKACKAKDAPLVEGSWCKFCPAAAVCPKLYEKTMELAKAEFADDGAIVLPVPESMNKVDIKKVLDFSDTLGSWLRAVETYAFNALERGEKIDGYKLVKKRAFRKWKETVNNDGLEVTIEDYLSTQFGDIAYHPRKLKSPAQIEALKIDKNLVASLCETPDNGNTLVPISDKRPEVSPSMEIDFEPISIEE